ncbi:SDR family oxidoreductase [Roseimarinus sediminis]|uniref:SDR family oxidoreductase n=1 Tax=Roseimarinus sediminis TaxID=1610899 RepID=UPI003D1DD554
MYLKNIGIKKERLQKYNLSFPKIRRKERLLNHPANFQGKVVIITGASSGIGKACAYEFAYQGATVVLAARRKDILYEIEEQIIALRGKAFTIVTDVKDINDCRSLIEQTIIQFGKLDILINNAGISMRATFEALDLTIIKELMDTNFYGTVYCTKFALPHILQQKGTIVGVSSITGLTPLPGRTGYAASKHAMDGFLNTLRLENIKKGLNVLVVHPGFTSSNIRNVALDKDGNSQQETPRNENKMMSSERVAKIIAKAIIKRERDLVLTPQGKLVVWMHKNMPGIADRIILNEMSKEPGSPFD